MKMMKPIVTTVAAYQIAKFFYDRNKDENTEITFAKGGIGEQIASKCPSLKKYNPSHWLIGSIPQTIACELLLKHDLNPNFFFIREKFNLAELERPLKSTCCPSIVPSGYVTVDWVMNKEDEGKSESQRKEEERGLPIIIIVPGLTGSSEAGYVRRTGCMLKKDKRNKVLVACYNPRGRGGNTLSTPFLYSAGYTEDIRRVIKSIKSSHPESDIILVSYSLGSNVVAKYMGEEGDDNLVSGAVCCATPVDMVLSTRNLTDTYSGRLMDPVLCSFVQKVREEIEDVLGKDSKFNIPHIKLAKTMFDFDDRAIAPMFEIKGGASDYYRQASSGPYLTRIRRPTLFLHAINDPIAPGGLIFKRDFSANPFLISTITQEGGHSMDWPSGHDMQKSWSRQVIYEFVQVLTHKPNRKEQLLIHTQHQNNVPLKAKL